jgi:hypothetical protein
VILLAWAFTILVLLAAIVRAVRTVASEIKVMFLFTLALLPNRVRLAAGKTNRHRFPACRCGAPAEENREGASRQSRTS